MLIGVISFSFMNGSLTSILANHDQENAVMNERIQILNSIYREYFLPLDLYMQCKKNLEYSNKSNYSEIVEFLDNLPHKLKMEVSVYIHESRYNKLKFLYENNKSNSFISWFCPLLNPVYLGDS